MTRTLFIPVSILLGLVVLIPFTTPERQQRIVRHLIESRIQKNAKIQPATTLQPFKQPASANQNPDRPGEKASTEVTSAFWVQIAATRKMYEAQQIAYQLRHAGHAIGIFSDPMKKEPKGFWHRVCVGPFISRHQADSAAQRIEPQYPQAFVRTLDQSHLSH